MKIKVTRRSKVGFGYNVTPTSTGDGYYYESPEAPDFEGTIRQVAEQIETDPTLNSMNCFMSVAWFVKVDGVWHRIVNESEAFLADLLEPGYGQYKQTDMGWGWVDSRYLVDEVDVEIE